jgi:hypothetical protein
LTTIDFGPALWAANIAMSSAGRDTPAFGHRSPRSRGRDVPRQRTPARREPRAYHYRGQAGRDEAVVAAQRQRDQGNDRRRGFIRTGRTCVRLVLDQGSAHVGAGLDLVLHEIEQHNGVGGHREIEQHGGVDDHNVDQHQQADERGQVERVAGHNAIEAGAGRIHVVFDTRASVCYTTRRNTRHEGLSLRL